MHWSLGIFEKECKIQWIHKHCHLWVQNLKLVFCLQVSNRMQVQQHHCSFLHFFNFTGQRFCLNTILMISKSNTTHSTNTSHNFVWKFSNEFLQFYLSLSSFRGLTINAYFPTFAKINSKTLSDMNTLVTLIFCEKTP